MEEGEKRFILAIEMENERDVQTFTDLVVALMAAREKHPSHNHGATMALAIILEELGEVARAILEHHASGDSLYPAYQEALEVAVTALRFCSETPAIVRAVDRAREDRSNGHQHRDGCNCAGACGCQPQSIRLEAEAP